MDIIKGLENVHHDAGRALTVGSFDGLHLGHQRILKRMTEVGGQVTVLTFDPHPQTVVNPNEPPPSLITSLDERVGLFERYGAQCLIIAHFDNQFAQIEPERFVEEILVGVIGVANLFVGPTHGFGKGRRGTVEILNNLAAKHGFKVHTIEAASRLGQTISSSRIRKALAEGDVLTAWRFLGRPFYLRGAVVKGDGRGVKLGFPTANLELDEPGKLHPPSGIYATITDVEGVRWPSVSHFGDRPTFPGTTASVETHIIGFIGDIYGKTVHLGLIDRLRDIAAFKNPAELLRQMEADRQAAKRRLAELGFSRDARMRLQRYGKITT